MEVLAMGVLKHKFEEDEEEEPEDEDDDSGE